MGGSRREKIFELAKGMRGRTKNCFKLAIRRVEKGLQYAYKGRRLKKRLMREEWIMQVGAASREHGLSYSRLIFGMNNAAIGVNRKMMAILAQHEPYSFRAIIDEAKGALRRIVEEDKLPAARRETALQNDYPSTIVPDADAPTTVDVGVVPRYEGPPLPPYPSRVKHFS